MRKHSNLPGRDRLLHHGVARRAEPPESTGSEAGYLVLALESGLPLNIRLLDGKELRGVVTGYDRDCIVLRPESGSPLMLRKAKVKYYWLERAAPAGS